ncbi:putative transporter YisQ [Spirochaetia bacterium]|nr:putative transporter YisQ [Spirochaetia bacterium]
MSDPNAFTMREKWNKKALFRLLWPLVVEQTLAVTIGAVDTVMMSSVGEYAVSGVSLVDAIATLLIIAFGALATGGSVVISQYIGRRDSKNATAASRQLIYTTVFVSLIIMIFTLILRTRLLKLIYGNIAGDVMQAADTYFRISALGYPFLSLYNADAALFRSIGNSRVTMMVSILVNIIHIALNFVLIYGLHMGVAGAAVSTLISRIVSALILTVLLMRLRRGPISLAGLFRIRIVPHMIRSILKVGIPGGIEGSMFQLGKIIVSRIATSFGTAALAANAVTGVINSFTNMSGTAIGIGMLTIVGQCVGAKDYDSAKYFTRRLMWLIVGVVTILSAVIALFIDPLLGIFRLSQEAHDMAKQFTWLLCAASPLLWSLSFSLPNALRAAGDAGYCMVAAVISMWLVRVIGAYLIAYVFHVGVMGIWIAMVADWVVRGICYAQRWKGGKWQTKQVITDTENV